MNIYRLTIALATSSVLIAGCANTAPQHSQRPYERSSAPDYASYGVVENIDVITTRNESGIGAGAVIGGVVGGLLGNQVGGGKGKTLATVIGVAGGAVAGNEIQKRRNASNPDETYRVRIRNDRGGGYQTLEAQEIGDLRVGDRVRIQDGNIYLN